MSVIALVMNLLLAILLLAALGLGWRLNRRLQVLRDSHDRFESAVRDLNQAAARAELGLADLRAATDEATDLLADRIEKGRALAARLERQTDKLERLADHMPPLRASAAAREPVMDAMAERRLGALLAAAREARPDRLETRLEPMRREPMRPAPMRPGPMRPEPILEPARPAAPVAPPPQASAMQAFAERSMAATATRRSRSVEEELFEDAPLTLDDAPGARR